jgi:hypothetical protein
MSKRLKQPTVLPRVIVGLTLSLAVLLAIGVGTFFGVRSFYRSIPSQLIQYEMDVEAMAKPLAPVSVRSELGDFEIPIKLPEVVRIAVPVRKVLDVPVKEEFQVPVNMTVHVPIDQEVFIKAEFPLEVSVPLDGIRLKARPFGLPAIPAILQGSLPLKLTVPFAGTVRIKTDVEVPIRRVFTVPFSKTLQVPLNFDLTLDLPIQRLIHVQFDGPLKLKAKITEEMPMRARFRVGLTKDGRIAVDQPSTAPKKKGAEPSLPP